MKKKLIALHIDHKHGNDMMSFSSDKEMDAWKAEEARKSWKEYTDDPMPEAQDELIERYYEMISEGWSDGEYWDWEYFEIDVPEVEELRSTLAKADELITQLLPEVKHIVLQDYGLLNKTLLEIRAVLEKTKGE